MICWSEIVFGDTNFVFFAVTLRSSLSVMHKTIVKYVMQAYSALLLLGFSIIYPKQAGIPLIVKGVNYLGKGLGAPRLTYCSISWGQIMQ